MSERMRIARAYEAARFAFYEGVLARHRDALPKFAGGSSPGRAESHTNEETS